MYSSTAPVFVLRCRLSESLMQAPIQLISSAAAIDAGLWRRNGGCMAEQLMNYTSVVPPLCRQMS